MPRVRVSTSHYIASPIKIDKNIPIPSPARRGRTTRYPWQDMDVGDSFLFPQEIKLNTCRSMAWDAGRKLRRKFWVRVTPEGARCWRIKLPESIGENNEKMGMRGLKT